MCHFCTFLKISIKSNLPAPKIRPFCSSTSFQVSWCIDSSHWKCRKWFLATFSQLCPRHLSSPVALDLWVPQRFFNTFFDIRRIDFLGYLDSIEGEIIQPLLYTEITFFRKELAELCACLESNSLRNIANWAIFAHFSNQLWRKTCHAQEIRLFPDRNPATHSSHWILPWISLTLSTTSSILARQINSYAAESALFYQKSIYSLLLIFSMWLLTFIWIFQLFMYSFPDYIFFPPQPAFYFNVVWPMRLYMCFWALALIWNVIFISDQGAHLSSNAVDDFTFPYPFKKHLSVILHHRSLLPPLAPMRIMILDFRNAGWYHWPGPSFPRFIHTSFLIDLR